MPEGPPSEPVTLVVEAGGAHLTRQLALVEARLRDIAAAARGPVGDWAGARSPPGASGCGRCSCCSPPGGAGVDRRRTSCARRRGRARPRGDAGPRRRPRRRRSAPRPSTVVVDRRPRRRRSPPATISSPARSPSWPPTTAPPRSGSLSEASSALAAGELLQRADAWDAGVSESAISAAASSRRRACSRPRVCWASWRPAAGPCSAPSGRRRPGLPAPRRHPRRQRPGRADGQGPRHRPARRHGDAAADPRPRTRPAAGPLDPRAITTPRRPRRSAMPSPRAARSTRPAAGARDGGDGQGAVAAELPARRREALLLVADGVVERYS